MGTKKQTRTHFRPATRGEKDAGILSWCPGHHFAPEDRRQGCLGPLAAGVQQGTSELLSVIPALSSCSHFPQINYSFLVPSATPCV